MICYIITESKFRTLQITQCLSITTTYKLTVCRVVTAVYFKNHLKTPIARKMFKSLMLNQVLRNVNTGINISQCTITKRIETYGL